MTTAEDDGASEEMAAEVPPSVGDLLVGALDGTLGRLARRPVRVRLGTSPTGLARGRLDVLLLELRGLATARLLIDRLLIRAEDVRIQPGFPARLRAGSIGLKATVTQDAIDAWTRQVHLPVHLELTEEGIIAHAGIGGMRMSEVAVELEAAGHSLLRLRPLRATMLGMRAPVMPSLPGYLPLPPLPAGARLTEVEPGDGSITLWLDAGELDEPITPDIAQRLIRRFTMPSLSRSLGG